MSFAQDADVMVLLDEKFDAFTEGTVDAPATTDISTPSYSSKLGQTLTSWKGSKVYEAGGALMIGDGGNIETARLSGYSYGKTIKITMDVKSRASYGGIVTVSMGSSYSQYISHQEELSDDKWHTITIYSASASSTYGLKISPLFIMEGMLIDNLKVEMSDKFVTPPTAKQPEIATATSFTATWDRVSGVTSYLLDVYTKAEGTGEKTYLLKDEEVTTTSKRVEGLEEGKTYYYTVRAKKGDNISDYSNEIEVVEVITSVDTPKGLAATNVTANGFTANWEAVAKAAKYEVMLFKTETMAETTEKKILDEDFSKVTVGELTGTVEFGKTQEYLDAYTTVPGWYGVAHCLAAGYMGISPISSKGTITTPALDLSANKGAGKLTINMAEGNRGTYYTGAEITISLYNGNEETAAETKTVTLEKDFKEYTVEFTKGTAESYIEISYSGSNKLFIDYMNVTTTLNAGDKYTSLVETREVEGNNTSADFSVAFDENTTYSYQVIAYVRTVVNGEIDLLGSAASEPVEVKYVPTGVNGITNNGEGTSLRITDGGVVVMLDSPAAINVYGMGGQMMKSVKGVKGENSISLAPGVAIVKAGNKSYKVVIR